MSRSRRLPSRFPIGTKFVIEGRPAGDGQLQVFRRFIEFPDGTHLRLPMRPDKRKSTAKSAASRRGAGGRRRSAIDRGARLGGRDSL